MLYMEMRSVSIGIALFILIIYATITNAQTMKDVKTKFTKKGFYSDYGCTKIAYIKYEKTKEGEHKVRSITSCAELKDGIFFKIEQLDVSYRYVGSKKTQILVEKYDSTDCNPDKIDEIYTFPPPGPYVRDHKSYNWTAWSSYCTPYVGGSMELIHTGKVTKHSEDFKEYRPKFKVQLHHDNKKCSTSNPQLLYFGDESCKKIGIQGYIGRRIDEDVLELLATGSYNRITPTIAIFVCSIMFAYVV